MKCHHQSTVRTIQKEKRRYPHRPIRKLEVDIERYQALLADPCLDTAQRADFLAALWSVIVAFIDLGYRVHPVQKVVDVPIGEDMDRAIIRAVEAHWREAA